MIGRTADNLVEAAMLDVMPRAAAAVDFGLDINPSLYAVYQTKIRSGEVTADQLHEAATAEDSDKALSNLIGTTVKTVMGSLGPEPE